MLWGSWLSLLPCWITGTSGWSGQISHITGSFVGHSSSDMLCFCVVENCKNINGHLCGRHVWFKKFPVSVGVFSHLDRKVYAPKCFVTIAWFLILPNCEPTAFQREKGNQTQEQCFNITTMKYISRSSQVHEVDQTSLPLQWIALLGKVFTGGLAPLLCSSKFPTKVDRHAKEC